MTTLLAPVSYPIAQWFTDAGVPNAGGTIYAYEAGTSTPALMYGDAHAGSSFTSKLLDASGRASIFLGASVYKIDVQDVDGNSLMGYPIDYIVGSIATGSVSASSTVDPNINANGFANDFQATINKAGSGTHPVFATVEIEPPTVGAGAATLTEADTLYISAAPSGGSSNYAIHVAAGVSKFDGGVQTPAVSSSASSVLSIASNVIAPTGSVHHLGAGLVKTITLPSFVVGPWTLRIIPDAAFTYDATGNIVVPAGGGTAVVNKTLAFTWDGSKFAPSY
jgi:hypothetical protein